MTKSMDWQRSARRTVQEIAPIETKVTRIRGESDGTSRLNPSEEDGRVISTRHFFEAPEAALFDQPMRKLSRQAYLPKSTSLCGRCSPSPPGPIICK
jgi:hypothetical protein